MAPRQQSKSKELEGIRTKQQDQEDSPRIRRNNQESEGSKRIRTKENEAEKSEINLAGVPGRASALSKLKIDGEPR